MPKLKAIIRKRKMNALRMNEIRRKKKTTGSEIEACSSFVECYEMNSSLATLQPAKNDYGVVSARNKKKADECAPDEALSRNLSSTLKGKELRLANSSENLKSAEAPTTSTDAPPNAVEAQTPSEARSTNIIAQTIWKHDDLLSLSRPKTQECATEPLVVAPGPEPEGTPSQDPLAITANTAAENMAVAPGMIETPTTDKQPASPISDSEIDDVNKLDLLPGEPYTSVGISGKSKPNESVIPANEIKRKANFEENKRNQLHEDDCSGILRKETKMVASFEGSEMGRRLKSAEKARKRRAEMTEEERKEVLEKMAARHAALRARETPEQRDQRLARQRRLSRDKYRAKIQKEDAARRKEVFDELAAEGKVPQKKAKTAGGKKGEKRFPVRYYKRLADEGELLVPTHSIRLDEPGPSFIQHTADGFENELDTERRATGYHYDECERFGLMIAAEIRNIEDLAERESVMSDIQNIIYRSVMRRRQKILERQAELETEPEPELEPEPEPEPEPEILLPKPIDDRTEEEIAVASIKHEPVDSSDSLIFLNLPPNQNHKSQSDIVLPNPIDNRTEEEIAIAAIKEEPVESEDNTIFFTVPPCHNQESQPDNAVSNPIVDRTEEMAIVNIKQEPENTSLSSQIFLTQSPHHSQESLSESDPLPDITIPKPINDDTEAIIAVTAIKDEPVETYEITISDANMSDNV